jgi:hypothetical protein
MEFCKIFRTQATSSRIRKFLVKVSTLCTYYQPNLWLSGLEHLDSYQEVIGLSTRLNFDIFFSFKSKFVKFSDNLVVLNFQERVTKLGAFSNNLITFKAPLVQF